MISRYYEGVVGDIENSTEGAALETHSDSIDVVPAAAAPRIVPHVVIQPQDVEMSTNVMGGPGWWA